MEKVQTFLAAFLCAFLGFSLLIMGTVLALEPPQRQEAAVSSPGFLLPQEDEGLELLVFLQGEDRLRLARISLEPTEGKVFLHLYSPEEMEGLSLAQRYNWGGASAVREALSLPGSCRSLLLKESQLPQLADLLGPLPLSLTEALPYGQAGLQLLLEPGEQLLEGEQLTAYLRQGQRRGSSEVEQRWQKLAEAFVSQYLRRAAQNPQELFLQLLDNVETDLSLADYDRCQQAFSFLLKLVPEPLQLR